MNKGKIIGGLLIAAGTGLTIYYGFVKKFSDGLTGFQKLTGKKTEETKDENAGTSKPKEGTPKTTKPTVAVVPPVAPPVAPTTPAKSLSQQLDAKKGTWLKAKYDDTPVYYIADSKIFFRYKKGQDIGRLGANLNNGYHKLYEVSGDTTSQGLKISDQFLKGILNL